MPDSSPFDDPEFRAQLERLGVAHEPGLASQVLGEIAPLLAAEGIDLDNLDLATTDLDAVNAALAAATERHNLMLFTPIGPQREAAYAVLRVVTRAVDDDDFELAQIVLGSIEPDPTEGTASVAHVTGVALGVLDRRHADPELRGSVSAARVPKWYAKASRAAAVDLLALASKGRAFDSLHSLTVRHGGLALLEGSALAVAASVIAQAAFEGLSVDDLVDEVLDGDTAPPARGGGRSAPGAAFMRPGVGPARPNPAELGGANRAERRAANRAARRGASSADRRMAREFRSWLEGEPGLSLEAAASGAQLFDALLGLARTRGFDLGDPLDIEPFIELLFELGEPGDLEAEQVTDEAFETLHDFVHFQLETAPNPAAWAEAHEAVEAALPDGDSPIEFLHDVLEQSESIDPEVRLAALAGLPVVRGVRDLLDWVGTSRAITSSGGLRRADIESVAAMIGVAARGAAKLPLGIDDADGIIYARSMYDVELLAAWWEALTTADVITQSATRVRPGVAAAAWRAGRMPPADVADMVAALIVAGVVSDTTHYGQQAVGELYSRVIRALAPEEPFDAPAVPGDLDRVARLVAERRMTLLDDAGVLEVAPSGEWIVPEALRGTVARGLIMAMSFLAAGIEG